MAEINLDILNAAYEDNLFKSRPTDRQFIYLSPGISTAWEILGIIEGRSDLGIESQGIADNLGLNQNTVKIYLRWLMSKGLIEVESISRKEPYVYRRKDIRTKRTRKGK